MSWYLLRPLIRCASQGQQLYNVFHDPEAENREGGAEGKYVGYRCVCDAPFPFFSLGFSFTITSGREFLISEPPSSVAS